MDEMPLEHVIGVDDEDAAFFAATMTGDLSVVQESVEQGTNCQ